MSVLVLVLVEESKSANQMSEAPLTNTRTNTSTEHHPGASQGCDRAGFDAAMMRSLRTNDTRFDALAATDTLGRSLLHEIAATLEKEG